MGWSRAGAGTPRAPWVGRRLHPSPSKEVAIYSICPTQHPRPSFLDSKGSHNAHSERALAPQTGHYFPLSCGICIPVQCPPVPHHPCCVPDGLPLPLLAWMVQEFEQGVGTAQLGRQGCQQNMGPCVSSLGSAHLTPELCSNHVATPSPCPCLHSGPRQTRCMTLPPWAPVCVGHLACRASQQSCQVGVVSPWQGWENSAGRDPVVTRVTQLVRGRDHVLNHCRASRCSRGSRCEDFRRHVLLASACFTLPARRVLCPALPVLTHLVLTTGLWERRY